MFILKFLFIVLLVAFIVLLVLTIYNKVSHPEKSFIDCIPFMSDFTSPQSADVIIDNVTDSTKTEALHASSSDTSVSSTVEKTKSSEPKTVKIKTEKNKTKKPKTAKKAASKSKASSKRKTAKNKADNIKKINGIGPTFEKKLNSMGINSFEQIATWSDEDVERIDQELELSGRPQREEWVAKAKILAAEKNA